MMVGPERRIGASWSLCGAPGGTLDGEHVTQPGERRLGLVDRRQPLDDRRALAQERLAQPREK
jgi:hypothetical protein